VPQALPALGEGALADGIEVCEVACRDLVAYIAAKLPFYELEAAFLRLYVPTPAEPDARLPPLLDELATPLAQLRASVEGRWRTPLLLGVLGTVSRAVAAAIELPGRTFRAADRALLRADADALCRFFCEGLDADTVRPTLKPLESIADAACGVVAAGAAARPAAPARAEHRPPPPPNPFD